MANFNLRLLKINEVERLQRKNPNLLIATPTDMALLLDCYTPHMSNDSLNTTEPHPPCYYFTMSKDVAYNIKGDKRFYEISPLGHLSSEYLDCTSEGIRPVLEFTDDEFLKLQMEDTSYGKMTTYGEYPMWVVSDNLTDVLNQNYYNGNLQRTGKKYTFIQCCEVPSVKTTVEEDDDYDDYELKSKTYIYNEY